MSVWDEVEARHDSIIKDEIVARFRSAVGGRLLPAQIDNAAHAIRQANGSREAATIASDIAATARVEVR